MGGGSRLTRFLAQGWHGQGGWGGGRLEEHLFNSPTLAPHRGHLCYRKKNAPQLLVRDTTVATWLPGGSSADPPLGCRVAPAEAGTAQLKRASSCPPGGVLGGGWALIAASPSTARLFQVLLQDESIAPQSEISFISRPGINWFPDKLAPDGHAGLRRRRC